MVMAKEMDGAQGWGESLPFADASAVWCDPVSGLPMGDGVGAIAQEDLDPYFVATTLTTAALLAIGLYPLGEWLQTHQGTISPASAPASPSAIAPSASSPDAQASSLASVPEVVAPESLNPESLNPESLNPESLNPESLNPEVAAPKLSNPESLNPEVAAPKLSNPESLNPESLNPEVANPEVANPEVANPEVAASQTLATSPSAQTAAPAALPTPSPDPTNAAIAQRLHQADLAARQRNYVEALAQLTPLPADPVAVRIMRTKARQYQRSLAVQVSRWLFEAERLAQQGNYTGARVYLQAISEPVRPHLPHDYAEAQRRLKHYRQQEAQQAQRQLDNALRAAEQGNFAAALRQLQTVPLGTPAYARARGAIVEYRQILQR
jgi:hypothetical protein